MTTSNKETNAYGLTTPDLWWNTTLEGVCSGNGGRIQTGPFGSQLHAHDYRDEGTPVVMPKQLGDNMISTDGIARISDEDVERLSRHKLREGDIVFSRRGDVTRRSYITKHEEGWLCGTGCMLIRPCHDDLLNEFLALFFSLPQFKDYITLNAVGATMPNLNTKILQNIPLFLPSRAVQHKIASILSAYDDLIENNTRRIAILEEMAQAIYREWFVNFRFPGFESVKLVDSPLGKIPEGWEVVTLKEMYPTSSGGTPSRKREEYYNGGTINWVKTKELKDRFLWDTEEKITELGLQKSSAKIYPANTVLMAMYGATIGQLGILGSEAAVNQACCAFRVHDSEYGCPFIFLYCLYNRTDIIGLRAGAAQQNVSQDVIREIDIARPPVGLVMQFNDVVSPTLQQMFTLQKATANLRTTRDLLLPKLISGKLDVEDLDIDLGITAEVLEESVA